MRRRAVAAATKPPAQASTRGAVASQHWPTAACVASLLAVRLASAALNTVHDCDEVFNYWEPLHFLLHGYGLQTWENSPQFALRSYLYVLLHALFAGPASLVFGSSAGKRLTFHALRAVLGAACAAAEAALCATAARAGGRRLGLLLWVTLLFSSGMFTSSTTLLPSAFTMVAFTAGAALCLGQRPLAAVVACVAGGLLGWPFAGLAAVPLGLHTLWVAGLLPTMAAAAGTAALVMAPSALLDALFYGRTTVSVWNLVRYNVAGGGQSALYGTEGPLFYVRNMFNAFNVALLLAAVAPMAELLAAHVAGRSLRRLVLVALMPLFLWIGAMSTIPHKEERFAYVVYPQVCLGAAVSLDALMELGSCRAVHSRIRFSRSLAMLSVFLLVAGTAALSAARTAALVGYYGAPMRVFAQLPELESQQPQLVCMGDEWYRFPSSFYLPGPQYRLGFVRTGFAGLLPLAFDTAAGGTQHAPAALNDRNEAVPEQYVDDPSAACDFWVGLETEPAPAAAQWKVIAAKPFLDSARSPALWRAFRVPLLSARRNVFTSLRLLRNAGKA